MTVSIIVPVYNAAERLPDCLEALRVQTHADLQIVLVDDGSTDGSGRLCDEAATADGRIIALHQRNTGPAGARNTGLDAAYGEWVMFVDAGDLVQPDYVQTLFDVAGAHNAALVVSDCIIAEGDGERAFGHVVTDKVYMDRNELYADFLAEKLSWSLWAKLYDAHLFDDLRFCEGDYVGEDLDVNSRIFAMEGLRVATCASTGYRYQVQAGSVDHTFTERHMNALEVFERVVQLVRSEGIRTPVSVESFYEERVLSTLRKALDAGSLTRVGRRVFKEAIVEHRWEVLRDKRASGQLKRRLLATCLGVRTYAVLHRLHG